MRNQDARPFLLLAVTALVALGLVNSGGTTDVQVWMRWLGEVDTRGLREGYAASFTDYPPLSLTLLYAVAQVARFLGIEAAACLKASLFLFWCLSGIAFWAWTRSAAMVLLLQLSILLNSVAMGYLDVWYTPTLILALWALQERRHALFSVLFGLSCLVKWQPLILAPVLFLHVAREHGFGTTAGTRWTALGRTVALPAAAIAAVLLLAFGTEWLVAFRRALNHPFLSGNALNFNWVILHGLQKWLPKALGGLVGGYGTVVQTRDLRYLLPPTLLFFALYGMILWQFWRRGRSYEAALRYALTGYLAYFMFKSGVHENHLYVAVIAAAALAAQARAETWTLVTWSLVANVNLVLFYGLDGSGLGWNRVVWVDLALPIAILNVGLFFAQLRRCLQAPPAPQAAA